MKRVAVIYQSKYGTTKQYANWISGELNADLLDGADVSANQLLSYDIVIYGGGLYGGGIRGIDLVTKNPCNKLVVFTVGLANPATTDYSAILNKTFSADALLNIKVFHLRGGIDYRRLGLLHKGMMAMLKKFKLDKIPPSEQTEEEKTMAETYGDKIDFTDKSTIAPLVTYVRTITI